MIPGNPPHPSKSDDEPVTIDLEANEAARRAIEHGDSETGTSSFDEAKIQPEATPEPIRETVAETPPERPAPSVAAIGHGTPALLASGIVGGLIALICAGAVQYAGFLPINAASKDHSQDVEA